jgi:peptidyl-prolyl cis-trans isomerase D
MLQDVQKSMQGTTAKVIVWSIAITFALFGVESIVGGIGGEPEVAEVNGDAIKESEFKVAVERKKRQVLAQMGEAADPSLLDEGMLASSVLDGLIQEKALEQDAESRGLYVPLVMVDEYIRNMSEFQVDGEFSNTRMQSVLGAAGFSLQMFRQSLAKQFLIDQTRAAMIGSAFVLKAEEADLIAIDRQARSFGSATIAADQYLSEVSVDDVEIAKYFEANSRDFRKPENVDVSFVVLRKDSLLESIDVSEEEVAQRYEAEILDFVSEEQRRGAHILVAFDEDASEEQALAKITRIEERLKAGEDFAELAKAESSDTASAADGGDLGFSAKGVYVAGFEEALFALNEGELSQPIKTEFGYHLIKLLGVQRNEPPTLEEKYSSLVEDIKNDKADLMFVDLSQQLADVSYSSPDLVEPAEELGLELKELVGVSRSSQDPLFSQPRVQKVLFDPETLSGENNSDLVELEDGVALVFKVDQFYAESDLELAQVSDQIREILLADKAADYAESIGKAFIVRVEAGEVPSLVAEDMGLEWSFNDSVRRDNFSVDVSLLFKVFAMPKPLDGKPTIAGFDVNGGDYAVVALDEVKGGSIDSISMIERQPITSSLGGSYGGADYSAYLKSVEQNAAVEKL